MVSLNFSTDGFEVDLEGIEKAEAFKRKLFIPYSHLVRVDDNAEELKLGLKLGGTSLRATKYDYGRFETNEGYGFYAMKERSRAFAIHLVDDRYKVLVLELEDNESAIEELRSHISSDAGEEI